MVLLHILNASMHLPNHKTYYVRGRAFPSKAEHDNAMRPNLDFQQKAGNVSITKFCRCFRLILMMQHALLQLDADIVVMVMKSRMCMVA